MHILRSLYHLPVIICATSHKNEYKNNTYTVLDFCDTIFLFRECYIVPWHCIVFNKPFLLVAGTVLLIIHLNVVDNIFYKEHILNL